MTDDDETDEQQGGEGRRDETPAGPPPFASPLDQILARYQELEALAARTSAIYNNVTSLQPLFDAADRYQALAQFSKFVSPSFARLQETARSVAALRQAVESPAVPVIKIPALAFHLPPDWYPPNWEEAPGHDVDDLGDKAVAIMQEEGIPMVWVPRPTIVMALVNAEDAEARNAVLLAARDDIADDCLAVLSVVTDPRLKPLADLAAAAVSDVRDGRDAPAQALAANVFDTLLRDAIRRGTIFDDPLPGRFKYPKVREHIRPVTDETFIRRFRADCVLAAAVPALQDYDPSDATPPRFIRHATAHSAGPEQYTPVNAIVAVMLAVSMLREAQSSGW